MKATNVHDVAARTGAHLVVPKQPGVVARHCAGFKRHFGLILSIVAWSGVFIAVVFLRWTYLFHGSAETARIDLSILPALAASLVVLTATIGFVLAQVVATEVSVRGSAGLLRRPGIVVPIVVLVCALGFSVFLLGRIEELFPEPDPLQMPQAQQSPQIDAALLISLLAIMAVGYLVWVGPRLLSAESLARGQMPKIDRNWLARVDRLTTQSASRADEPVDPDDPLLIVERLLARGIERGDTASVRDTLRVLREHLHTFVMETDVRSVDAYLGAQLSGVIHVAGAKADSHFLTQLVKLADDLGKPDASSWQQSLRLLTRPAGEVLLRLVLEECVYRRMWQPATDAANVVLKRSAALSINLRAASPQDARQARLNNRTALNFGHQYPGYLATLGCSARPEPTPTASSDAGAFLMVSLQQLALMVLKNPNEEARERLLGLIVPEISRLQACIDPTDAGQQGWSSLLDLASKEDKPRDEGLAKAVVTQLGSTLDASARSDEANAKYVTRILDAAADVFDRFPSVSLLFTNMVSNTRDGLIEARAKASLSEPGEVEKLLEVYLQKASQTGGTS